MALALSFSLGQDFYLQDYRFVVTRIGEEAGGTLKGPDGTIYEIEGTKSLALPHHTNISEGPKADPSEIRLIFEAPKSVSILRGVLYKDIHEQ